MMTTMPMTMNVESGGRIENVTDMTTTKTNVIRGGIKIRTGTTDGNFQIRSLHCSTVDKIILSYKIELVRVDADRIFQL